MKITGTHDINAPRKHVYAALIDPLILQRCIPGCESLVETEANNYIATMKAGIGPVKGVFKGHVRLEDMQPPEHYRMIVDGKGGPGFVKGTGNFHLEENNDGTLVKYEGEMQVGGVIASVGQRMIEAAAKMLAAQFFKALEAEIKSAPDALHADGKETLSTSTQ